MEEKLKAIVAAGGSGGHIIPALAIINEMQKNSVDVLFIGNENSMESELVAKKGIPFKVINVQKLYRSFTWKHIKFPFKLVRSILVAKKIIRQYQPDFFLGTGGFVSGAVGLAAKFEAIPIFLQEQNCYPGLTTRFLSKFAQKIYLGNVGAKKYFKKATVLYTSNPINESVREEIESINPIEFNLYPEWFTLFVIGGSQGSQAINNIILKILSDLQKEKINLIWQTGKRNYADLQKQVAGKKGVYCFAFSNQIGKFYNAANAVISRAGAITLAEIEQKKLPSILIPLPTAAENHQFYNALELQNRKVAIMIEQKDLTPQKMRDAIKKIRNGFDHFTKTDKTNPAKIIAEDIIQTIKGKLC